MVEENKQHFGILFFVISKKVKHNWNTKSICAVYGEGAVTDPMCQEWFEKFVAGHFLVNDPPRAGRQDEVDSDQTETLIENNQCYTLQDLANILKISKSSTEIICTSLVTLTSLMFGFHIS